MINNHRLVLILILLIAALFRFIGTSPGYPPIHTDEGISHSQGIAMILEKTLDPKYGYGVPYNYPILVPLINAIFYLFIFIPVYSLSYLIFHLDDIVKIFQNNSFEQLAGIFDKNILGPNRMNVVFWGRIVTALVGVGVTLMGYLVGKQLFRSTTVGLLSAFFIAINYRQVLNSHFGLPDIYNAFFLLLSLYLTIKLWQEQSTKNYFLAGIGAALFFSTKFQFFALPPFFLVLAFIALKEKSWIKRVKFFLSSEVILLVAALFSTALILNYFHLLHYKETLEQVEYSALKYRYGRSELDFYPLAYLFNIGVGPVMSITVLIGIILGLRFYFRQTVLLLSVIGPFFWMMVYYTEGGFYTRNFVTIIPLLLICAACGMSKLIEFLKRYSPLISITTGILIISIIICQSLKNSLIVPWEYSQEWNMTVLQRWLGKNLPVGAVIKTYPSMVLPQKKFKVIKNEDPNGYSIKQMQEEGIEWAVINTDWFSDLYLWWMIQGTGNSLKYWNRPDEELLESPISKMFLELKDHIVFEVLNPWQAPDNNYLLIKVSPKISDKQFPIIQSKFDPKIHLFSYSIGGM